MTDLAICNLSYVRLDDFLEYLFYHYLQAQYHCSRSFPHCREAPHHGPSYPLHCEGCVYTVPASAPVKWSCSCWLCIARTSAVTWLQSLLCPCKPQSSQLVRWRRRGRADPLSQLGCARLAGTSSSMSVAATPDRPASRMSPSVTSFGHPWSQI